MLRACSTIMLLMVLAFLLATSPVLGTKKQRIVIHDTFTQSPTQSTSQRNNGFDHYKNFRSGGGSQAPQSTSKACPARSVLRVDFTPAPGGDGRLYGNIFGSGVLLASSQDVFEYEVMWKDRGCNCGAEFEVGTQYRLRDDGALDERGYSPHSERNANMTSVAFGKWYRRKWSLAPVEGKYIDKFVLSAFSQPGATVTAFFKYIRVVRGDEKRRVVFDSGSEPPNITPYFPGTIVASCQHEVTFNGDTIHASGGKSPLEGETLVVQHGSVITLTGTVESLSLSELSTQSNTCPYFLPITREFAWRSTVIDQRVRLTSLEIRCRLPAPWASVRLFEITKWNASTRPGSVQFAPWHLHATLRIPESSILSHLVNGSWIDVVVEYFLVLSDWESSIFQTTVRSFQLQLE